LEAISIVKSAAAAGCSELELESRLSYLEPGFINIFGEIELKE
jgi:hypothetical protein